MPFLNLAIYILYSHDKILLFAEYFWDSYNKKDQSWSKTLNIFSTLYLPILMTMLVLELLSQENNTIMSWKASSIVLYVLNF